jgi:hypothetical protein
MNRLVPNMDAEVPDRGDSGEIPQQQPFDAHPRARRRADRQHDPPVERQFQRQRPVAAVEVGKPEEGLQHGQIGEVLRQRGPERHVTEGEAQADG